MGYQDKGSSGIVCTVSRQAGSVAGTSVVISKKIAGCGAKGVTAAKDLFKRPFVVFRPGRDGKSKVAAEESSVARIAAQETGRKKAAKALIEALESDLSAARRELKRAQSQADKTQGKLASELGDLKAEHESLISDLKDVQNKAAEAAEREKQMQDEVKTLESNLAAAQSSLAKSTPLPVRVAEKIEVVASKKKVESGKRPSVAKSSKELDAAMEGQLAREVRVVKFPGMSPVTADEVEGAVFPNLTDKVIFSQALSDISSHDSGVRLDAVKTIAGIRHELSVKVLMAQVAGDRSVQVRREAVKALATLKLKEGLSAIEQALTDEASSVRLAAVWGLYHLDGSESVGSMIRMFGDEDEEVRRRAATCIGWLGQEQLAVELLPLLDDSSSSVCRAAIEAMGNLRNRQVVSSLIKRLKDADELTRKSLVNAIERITGKKMGKTFPKTDKEFARMVVRWQEWWKDELLE